MPNRIIKESTFLSDRIARLSDFEFRLWVGLITQADDAGRGDARPAIIKGYIFALRERVTIKDIESALHALAAAGCVSLYTVGGKPYYAFPSWTAHQRIRDVKPKYPAPEDGALTDCGELRQIAADCGYNPNPNPNTNPKEGVRAMRFTPPTPGEVSEYCNERKNGVDAEKFCAYYAANGWKVGKNPMKDWRAAVRSWEKNCFESGKPAKASVATQSFDAEEAFAKAMKRSYEEG